MLTIHAINAFEDNYIWFIQAANSSSVLIVDPGDATPVLEALNKYELTPVAIIITHGCHDHVDGIEVILEHYDVPVYGPKNEFIPCITHPLSACDDLVISEQFPIISVLDIPGHTKGHIGFLIEGKLFCGDALFAAGCGRLHSGPAEVLFQSIQTIAALPDDTQIYCAHEYTVANLKFAITVEPKNEAIAQRIIDTDRLRQQGLPSLPSSLGLERQTNPFLRCGQSGVKEAVTSHSAVRLDTEEQVFKQLRLWKDKY